MIPRKKNICQIDKQNQPDIEPWQRIISSAIRDPAELLRALQLPLHTISASNAAATDFALLVPKGYLSRIKPGDADDPLLQQILPQIQELDSHTAYSLDPVGDIDSMVVPGLLHKYHGRVLLSLTGACAIHCRYCFRRHFPYSETQATLKNWSQIESYLAADTSIHEVILSGGDPLSLNDRQLHAWITSIASIPHIQRLRIHTRLPIVVPERLTESLMEIFVATRLQVVMVIHCNHAQEIDRHVTSGLKLCAKHNIMLLNQAVLLKGVNNSTEALLQLSESLIENGVLPYYLHVLDKVKGAQHFDLSAAQVQQLYRSLQQQLPGYLVPKLVREEAGKASKTSVLT